MTECIVIAVVEIVQSEIFGKIDSLSDTVSATQPWQ